MKTNTIRMVALFAATVSLLSANDSSNDSPTGNITADAALVRTGSFPKLTWDITYPEITDDILFIDPEKTLTTQKELKMQIRIIAADVQTKQTYWDYYRRRYVSNYWYEPVKAYFKLNNDSWSHVFTGTQPDVIPSQILRTQVVPEGTKIRFASMANYSGSPGWFYSGLSSSNNVVLLKDGDTPPNFTTWTTQSTLGTHIAPYLDENGKVDIGPRDVIVAFELTHVMPNSYNQGDMQDMILLLTFL